MTKKSKLNDRNSHAGKSRDQKENYYKFLRQSQSKIDETSTGDEITTLAPTVKESPYKKVRVIGKKSQRQPKPYKSLSTIIQENIKSIVYTTLVTAVLGVCVTVVWNQQAEIAKASADLISIHDNLSKLEDKYQNIDDDSKDTIRLTTEISKDLEYIQHRLQKVENRLKL